MPKRAAGLSPWEVLDICTSQKPTANNIRSVLDWAKSQASAVKVLPLLMLQTDNRLSRLGHHEPFMAAFTACIASPEGLDILLRVVQEDWNPMRVLHALRGLIAVAGTDREDIWAKLFEIAQTRILRVHYNLITSAAQQQNRPVPEEVLNAHMQHEAQRGKFDFYPDFDARRVTYEPYLNKVLTEWAPRDTDEETASSTDSDGDVGGKRHSKRLRHKGD
eukprot:TRINITY_DN15801_c0_g1_i1.p1 TRINITY_DN15801_c0_g1~~TRINITY_DN15801_c0_g1_i1.p1  ORF type:complete len:228 (-),score=26.84 TRINITY_DN15801_c0_g1_i1:25-681(-)